MRRSRLFTSDGGFLHYTVLNYIDKGLNFVIPFLILKSHFTTVYADVEYLISISLLLSSFSDLGLRQYLFYAYRDVKDGNQFCLEIDRLTYLLVGGYVILSLLIYFLTGLNNLLLYCLFRCIFLTFINVKGSVCRLKDKPTDVFKYSLSINVLITFVLVVFKYIDADFNLVSYASIYIMFAGFVLMKMFYLIYEDRRLIYKILSLIRKSIYYAYPLILILIMTNIQNNIAKIYGYQKLSMDDFQSLAILLRCFTFLLLAHASVISYFSKYIYISVGGIKKADFFKYLYLILVAFVIMFSFILVSNYFLILGYISFNIEFYILLITYFCMMIRAYIEQYFGKFALLRYPTISTAISFLFFLIPFLCFDIFDNSLIALLSILMLSEIINMLMIIYFYKFKLKRHIYE